MTFVTTEKAITFIIEGDMYVCSSDDDRYDRLKKALEDGDEKKALRIYDSRLTNKAKDLLNGLKRGVE